jgi:hypothetical protein
MDLDDKEFLHPFQLSSGVFFANNMGPESLFLEWS